MRRGELDHTPDAARPKMGKDDDEFQAARMISSTAAVNTSQGGSAANPDLTRRHSGSARGTATAHKSWNQILSTQGRTRHDRTTVSDFFQTGAIATLHRLGRTDVTRVERELAAFSEETPIALVLPCH